MTHQSTIRFFRVNQVAATIGGVLMYVAGESLLAIAMLVSISLGAGIVLFMQDRFTKEVLDLFNERGESAQQVMEIANETLSKLEEATKLNANFQWAHREQLVMIRDFLQDHGKDQTLQMFGKLLEAQTGVIPPGWVEDPQEFLRKIDRKDPSGDGH